MFRISTGWWNDIVNLIRPFSNGLRAFFQNGSVEFLRKVPRILKIFFYTSYNIRLNFRTVLRQSVSQVRTRRGWGTNQNQNTLLRGQRKTLTTHFCWTPCIYIHNTCYFLSKKREGGWIGNISLNFKNSYFFRSNLNVSKSNIFYESRNDIWMFLNYIHIVYVIWQFWIETFETLRDGR